MFIDYAHSSVTYRFISLNDKSICEYWDTNLIYLNMFISMIVWVEIFIMYVIFNKVNIWLTSWIVKISSITSFAYY